MGANQSLNTEIKHDKVNTIWKNLKDGKYKDLKVKELKRRRNHDYIDEFCDKDLGDEDYNVGYGMDDRTRKFISIRGKLILEDGSEQYFAQTFFQRYSQESSFWIDATFHITKFDEEFFSRSELFYRTSFNNERADFIEQLLINKFVKATEKHNNHEDQGNLLKFHYSWDCTVGEFNLKPKIKYFILGYNDLIETIDEKIIVLTLFAKRYDENSLISLLPNELIKIILKTKFLKKLE